MFKISIKNTLFVFTIFLIAMMISSCAYVPKMKKPAATIKTEKSTSGSSGKTAGVILEQPKFRISKKTAAAYNTALKHMRAKNYDTAILEMHKVAKMDERISGPWVNIGVAYKELGNVEKAKSAFQKALSINPKNPFALNELAILNRIDGKFEQAEKLYKQALSTYPDYENAHLNLAILCDVYLRKIDCALNHYQAYLNLSDGQDKQVNAWVSQLKKQGS
ncbi:MAG: tetratricopeptide repeat protein [Pseudomonadota bacterium]